MTEYMEAIIIDRTSFRYKKVSIRLGLNIFKVKGIVILKLYASIRINTRRYI
jgi:hypothetical protein